MRRTQAARRLPSAAVLGAAFLLAVPAVAQEGEENPLAEIHWQDGPTTGRLGDLATLAVPEGFRFADGEGARALLRATQNLPSGEELGVVIPADPEKSGGWFVIFDFSDVGYVKDDERDAIDADALLETLQDSTRRSNEVRKEKGYPTLELTGWAKPPFYDPKTNNLTWATHLTSESGGASVNWSTRLLGRKGYMNADLVIAPEDLETVLPEFDGLLAGFGYSEGNRYAEFKKGDKVAAYGLTALIVGGAGAVALKTGLLARFWKWIAAGAIALLAGLKKAFSKATSMGETAVPGPDAAPRA
jgi:uncharacterized membrane-anchored protein